MPRYYYTRQHLGNLKADSHALRLSVSYTPTSTLQLEAETAYQRTSFDDGSRSGSDSGFDNVILRGKYRFYRALETWGDKQAAIRFGLELPTGNKSAPTEAELDEPEFVRRQLGSIERRTGVSCGYVILSSSSPHHLWSEHRSDCARRTRRVSHGPRVSYQHGF